VPRAGLSTNSRRAPACAAGMTLTLVAALLGGSRVPIDGELGDGPFLGLDWFLLNLIAYSALFIPLERLFARLPDQPVFRTSWRTDLSYFFVSTLFVQITTLLTLQPAMVLFSWASHPGLQAWVAAQPGPFFAWVHLYDPHAPYEPPEPFREAHAGRPYDGEVAYADRCVGQLLQAVGTARPSPEPLAVVPRGR